jgi:hypothetical protein
LVPVAKKRKAPDGELPSFARFTGQEPEPEPEPEPRPRRGPRPRPTRVRVKAGERKAKARPKARPRKKKEEEPELDEMGLPKKKRNRVLAALINGSKRIKQKVLMIVPEDPIDKMRFKLRWLGFLKFPISFLIIVAIAILLTLVLWFHLYNYEATFMLYSRSVSVLYILIPACIGIFSLIYFGINLTLINRKERRMTKALEAMLEKEAETKKALKAKEKKGTKEEDKEAEPEKKKKGSTRQGLNITS